MCRMGIYDREYMKNDETARRVMKKKTKRVTWWKQLLFKMWVILRRLMPGK